MASESVDVNKSVRKFKTQQEAYAYMIDAWYAIARKIPIAKSTIKNIVDGLQPHLDESNNFTAEKKQERAAWLGNESWKLISKFAPTYVKGIDAPIVIVLPKELVGYKNVRFGAVHIRETNIISFADDNITPMGSWQTPSSVELGIHETLHYLAELTRKLNSATKPSSLEDFIPNRFLKPNLDSLYTGRWLNEGITEYFALRIAHEQYPEERRYGRYEFGVLTTDLMVALTDIETVKKAYFTGKLAELEKKIDDKLGTGTFAKTCLSKNETEGYAYLRQSVINANLSRLRSDQELVVTSSALRFHDGTSGQNLLQALQKIESSRNERLNNVQ